LGRRLSLRRLGLLLGGDDGLAALSEAVEVLADSPAPLEYARGLVELGAATRRAGQRRQAREHLAAGLELARRCGATRPTQRAREELRASGARPRREVRSGAAALTPSELRVATMAGEGMSNPDIGQALFITRHTVETHMRNILRKLGVSSRAQIATALAGEAADSP
jgi:DNA-binding CsgD family transcriptional regulator